MIAASGNSFASTILDEVLSAEAAFPVPLSENAHKIDSSSAQSPAEEALGSLNQYFPSPHLPKANGSGSARAAPESISTGQAVRPVFLADDPFFSDSQYKVVAPNFPSALFFQQMACIDDVSQKGVSLSDYSCLFPAFASLSLVPAAPPTFPASELLLPSVLLSSYGLSASGQHLSPVLEVNLEESEAGVFPDFPGIATSVADDCLFCSFESSVSSLNLVPFCNLLHQLLLQTTECILDQQWELRRMAECVCCLMLIPLICSARQ